MKVQGEPGMGTFRGNIKPSLLVAWLRRTCKRYEFNVRQHNELPDFTYDIYLLPPGPDFHP
jgi:hypothetical protein